MALIFTTFNWFLFYIQYPIFNSAQLNIQKAPESLRHYRYKTYYGTTRIRHQCRKTAALSCHRFLVNSGVEKVTTFKYGLEFLPPDVSK